MESRVKEATVVEKTGVFSEIKEKRYELTMEYKGVQGKKILVICINPASSKIETSDTTTNYITNNLCSMGYSTITICNLFADVTSKLKTSVVSDNTDNITYIKEVLERNFDEILIGYGTTFKGNKVVEEEKEKLYKILTPYKTKLVKITDAKGLYQNLETIHPLFAGQRFSGTWKLIKHTMPKIKVRKVVKENEQIASKNI